MVDERVGFQVSIADAMQQVDLILLPPEEKEQHAAEQRARENMQGAIGLGLQIVGMPGAGS